MMVVILGSRLRADILLEFDSLLLFLVPSIDAGWVEVTLALVTGPRVAANFAAFSSCG
jgi:hypothetical protein